MRDFAAFGLIYLGTPFTAYRLGIEQAWADASELAARMLKAGAKVFSPIAHSYPLSLHGDLDPRDHKIWLPFCEPMMAVCNCLIVAKLDGWADSFGIKHEIEFFRAAGKPVLFLDPETLEITSVGQDRSAA